MQAAKRPRAVIKALLLDQRVVAGLGNIYADEVLFAASVHPLRTAATLTEAEHKRLAAAMTNILAEAIDKRGTTFRDYQNFLRVFQKQGEPCPHCGTPIERIKVTGRSSFFCPRCQVPPVAKKANVYRQSGDFRQ